MKKNAIIYNKYSANLNKRYLQGLCKQQRNIYRNYLFFNYLFLKNTLTDDF